MPYTKQQKKELVEKIDAVFSTIQYPGDDNLVENNIDYEGLLPVFKGIHWKALSVEVLRYNASGLSFLSPDAFCFYLPAYLIASITHFKEADIISQDLVSSLVLPMPNEIEKERFFSITKRLNLQQKSAVRAYLEYMKAEHSGSFPSREPYKALNRFWSKFS